MDGVKEYMGIEYQVDPPFFFSFLPGSALRWSHWNRFFTDDEIDNPSDEAMRRAIERAHADAPVYRGDIRYRQRKDV